MDPASPKKTRAGGKFHARNPALADAIAAEESASEDAPAFHAASAYAPNPITAMPPARPSEPSMKLKRFVIHAMANTTTSKAAMGQPELAATTYTAAAEAATWAPSRGSAGRLRTSSARDTAVRSAAHARSARNVSSANQAPMESAPSITPMPP